MTERLQKLREELRIQDIEALLIVDNLNIRYISGFTGSYAVLLVTGNTAFLLTDSRYTEQAREECPDFTVEVVGHEWIPAVQCLIQRFSSRKVGFEGHALDYKHWRELDMGLRTMQLVPVDDLVGRLRMVKDENEVAAIKEAVRIADLTYGEAIRVLNPGSSERELALEIDMRLRKNGADKEGFDTIVASGTRSALPHAKPTDKRISNGELIVLDFSAKWQGYHSDITRTIVLGAPDQKQEEIYRIILEAQSRAIVAVKPGITGGEVDAAARDYIRSCGYGEYFGHGLGHGLGLAIHDGRILAKESDIIMEAGMVVTVEPGIYIPDWGGIRIEDDVLITKTGCEVLTRSPKTIRPA